jgi:hypothetical protein
MAQSDLSLPRTVFGTVFALMLNLIALMLILVALESASIAPM